MAPIHQRARTSVVAKTPRKGFTLVELMTTIAVMAILTSIALADFINPLVDLRQKTLAAEFAEVITLARQEADSRRQVVTLCPRSPSGGCLAAAANWNTGWVLFQDTDADGVVDSGEPIILVRGKLDERSTLGPDGKTISFDPEGMVIDIPSGTRSFRVSDSKVLSAKRYLVVGRAGRASNLALADCTTDKGCTP
ncbi:MAG: hypothetical protein C4K60_08860 [Ideonella sp. MAG2]|nr:MAG: hypothetical protein C4K60_08860 [Ideonella sp. MAG2]